MNTIEFAKQIRELSLSMVHEAHASHIGGALSMTDLLSVLYTDILKYDAKNPQWAERDRFLLSKGHACVALYAALALKGFYPVEDLETYGKDDSKFLCHITHHVPGVEISAGSLGHGLSFGVGIALAAQRQHKDYRTYVMLGDGEMDEGSNWEALLFAAHHHLNHLCAIVDYNKIQSFGNTNDVINLEPLADKLKAFNFNVIEIDGHDHTAIRKAFEQFLAEETKPTVIVANTVKGKGVSFMENKLAWHYKSPDDEQYQTALKEIEK
jgi:transketolase